MRGQIAVITGASRGIGEATARALAAAGARVALLARSSDELERIASELRAAGADAWSYPVDVSDAAAVERFARDLARDLGPPDVLINNAGAGRFLAVDETSPAEAAAMMACPYQAAFDMTRALLPEMLRRRRGVIVNINSPVSRFVWPGAAAYAAARWALRGFTMALRLDLHGTGVRVMEVLPARVESTYFERNPGSAERIPRIARLVRTLPPAEVATALVHGLEAEKRAVVIPAMLRLLLLVNVLAPAMVSRFMLETGWRRSQ